MVTSGPSNHLLFEGLDVIAHTIARRVSRFLEKAGYLIRDAESEYLDLMQDEEDAMGAIVGASILAKANPSVTMVLDHFGSPLGIGPYEGKQLEVLRRGNKVSRRSKIAVMFTLSWVALI